MGLWPSVRMAVWPVPKLMKHRPGASRLMVAMPLAATGARRSPGTLTPVPRRVPSGAEAHAPRVARGQRQHGPAVGADHLAVRDPAVGEAEILGVGDVADLVHLGRDDPEVHGAPMLPCRP